MGLDRFRFTECKPTNIKETLLSQYECAYNDPSRNIRQFQDNAPQWNPKTNTYVYDFKGRVTQPSIKNFQMIPVPVKGQENREKTLGQFVLQFGKRAENEFILDLQFPLSIYQGFGLALSAFDTE